MDDLDQLSCITLSSYFERAIVCAKSIISNFDEIDEVKGAELITKNLIQRRTLIALEISANLYKTAPTIPLNITRKILRTFINEVILSYVAEGASCEVSSDAHFLLVDWATLGVLAPIPYDTETLNRLGQYALKVEGRIGSVKAGQLLGALIARGGETRAALLEQVPEHLRLSVLAKLASEQVDIPDNQWLDLILAEEEGGGGQEGDALQAEEAEAAGRSVDEEISLIIAMRSSPKYCQLIQHKGEYSSNVRIASEAGTSLYYNLRDQRENFLKGIIENLTTTTTTTTTTTNTTELGQRHVMIYAFLNEFSRDVNICCMEPSETWSRIRDFLIQGLEHENPLNPSRSIMIHYQIISMLWNMFRLRQIPLSDIPSFISQFLRLALWNSDGLTRHRANSVLQEAIGRYGLHDACDLIPNLESPADETAGGGGMSSLSFGEILARRYTPIARHSPIGYEGSIIGGVRTLMAHDHPAYFRHCNTIHHLIQNLGSEYLNVSQFINNILAIMLNDDHIDPLLDFKKWQHTRHLSLIISLITVDGYKPSESIRDNLWLLARALVSRWSRVRVSSCVPTKGNLDIHCHHASLIAYSVRYWIIICRLADSKFENEVKVTHGITSLLAKHECTAGKLYLKEWHRFRKIKVRNYPHVRRSDIKEAENLPAMLLLEELPSILADCSRDLDLISEFSGTFEEFFRKQRLRILQNGIPICVIVMYLDLCGLARLADPDIFRRSFEAADYFASQHPEPVIRALSQEWREYFEISDELVHMEKVERCERVYWRLRDRRVGWRGYYSSSRDWFEFLGDVESIKIRPFTSPTFYYDDHLDPALLTQKQNLNLMGTSNCIVSSKAIARDWGREFDCRSPTESYRMTLGPWEKRGFFYALALRLIRQAEEREAVVRGSTTGSTTDGVRAPPPTDVCSTDHSLNPPPPPPPSLLSTDLPSPPSAAAHDGELEENLDDFVKVDCQDDLVILIADEMMVGCCEKKGYELSEKIAELSVSLGIVG